MNRRLITQIHTGTIHVVLLLLPLIFTSVNDELFEFPKMLIIYAAAIIMIGCFAARSVIEKKVSIPRTPFDLPILLFLGSQILSTVFSIDPHTSFYGYYSRFNGGLLSIISYIILYYAGVQVITKENHRRYGTSLLTGAALAALYAFPEHFGHSPSCLIITGSFTADCWVQDVKTRVFGTLGQPNWLAAYMVIALPLAVAKIQENVQKISTSTQYVKPVLWTLSFLLFSSVLFFTKSRSGILAAGIALTMQLVLSFLFHSKKDVRRAAFVGIPLITFAVLLFLISNPVRDRLLPQAPVTTPAAPAAGTQLDNGGSESGDIRKVVWSGAIKVWQRYPILGSGVETFAYSYYKDRPQAHNLLSEWDFLYNKAHNEFLNYLATTGIVGLLSYSIMYGSFVLFPLWWVYSKRPRSIVSGHRSISIEIVDDAAFSESDSMLLIAISSALAGLAISNFFGFSTVLVAFLTFFLPGIAVIVADKKRILTIHLPSWIGKVWVKQTFIALILLMSLYSLFSIFSMWETDRLFARGKAFLDQNDSQEGALLVQEAVKRAPNEPVYEDKLSVTIAELSYILSQSDESTRAAELAQAAIDYSDHVIARHPSNVNFYKTRVHIFTLLSQISPVFYDEAAKALRAAIELSPTDPKLTRNMAIIAKAKGDVALQEQYLKETIALRPIDITSRLDLAALYEATEKKSEARAIYETVIQLDPENVQAKTRIASLSATPKK